MSWDSLVYQFFWILGFADESNGCVFEFRDELFAMADIVTPNVKEASALLGGVPLRTVADMYSAAKSIHNLGPK